MHDTALAIGDLFFKTYFPQPPAMILDVGSQDMNGSLRSRAPQGSTYIGVDLQPAAGVDIVLNDPNQLPFGDDNFDAAVSTSCFEHDDLFWLTFLEMVRVTRRGGYVYINAPSNGWYHAHPADSWRFFPDAGVALAKWANRQGWPVVLIESFISRRGAEIWNDCVMVFRKGTDAGPIADRIADLLPGAYNVRRYGSGALERFSQASEDIVLIATLRQRLAAAEAKLAELAASPDRLPE